MSKDLFYFNRQDRIATVVLLSVIVATQVIRFNMPKPERDDYASVPDSLITAWTDVRRDSVRRMPAVVTYAQNKPKRSPVPAKAVWKKDSVRDTTFVPRYRLKSRPIQKVDLNAADSLQLTGLPGIGAWTAQKIMNYRRNLGGFISEAQLMEIEGLPDSLLQWFTVTDTIPVIRIRVNLASVSELRRHPYLNFYQARAIVELRRERGKVQGPGQLSLLEEFTDQDLERLEPYLDFE